VYYHDLGCSMSYQFSLFYFPFLKFHQAFAMVDHPFLFINQHRKQKHPPKYKTLFHKLSLKRIDVHKLSLKFIERFWKKKLTLITAINCLLLQVFRVMPLFLLFSHTVFTFPFSVYMASLVSVWQRLEFGKCLH
jgi:hypothetical protein